MVVAPPEEERPPPALAEPCAPPAYALPPLPPPRPRAAEGAPPLRAVGAHRGSSSGVILGTLLAVALVLVTLGAALAFTRRATPTHAIAPSTAARNVSLLYDGGAPRGR